jgi:hypothetical protein
MTTQRGILGVPYNVLSRLLALPLGHEIERITLSEHPYAPGINIVVRGLAMPTTHPGCALMVEDYERFILTAEARAQAAKEHWAKHQGES